MNTIFKTKLDICDFQTIELPQNYNILHIGKQEAVRAFGMNAIVICRL